MGRYKRRMDKESVLIFGAALVVACMIGAVMVLKIAPLLRMAD